jgi:hypothetical protein
MQVVNIPGGNPTSTSIESSANPATSGQAITFTATVSSALGTPTGIVTFRIGSIVTTGLLINGKATFTIPTLNPGTYAVTATYNGSGGFQSSTSAVLTQTVLDIDG